MPDRNRDHVWPVWRAGPQPRSCGAPDLNRDHGRPVWRAGPQPRSCEFSVARRTSTAMMGGQCGVPDLNCDHVHSVLCVNRCRHESKYLREAGGCIIFSATSFLLPVHGTKVDDNPHLTTPTRHVMVGITRSNLICFLFLLAVVSFAKMRRMQQEYYTIFGFNLQFGEAISELAAIGGTSNCSNEG